MPDTCTYVSDTIILVSSVGQTSLNTGTSLINISNDLNNQLFVAVCRNEFSKVKKLLSSGADINFKSDSLDETLLHKVIRQRKRKMLELLIEHGAVVDTLDSNNMTPLLCAASVGKKIGSEMVLRLLAAGADATYQRKSDGMTAYKFALWGDCTDEVYQALLDAGATVPGKDFVILRIV